MPAAAPLPAQHGAAPNPQCQRLRKLPLYCTPKVGHGVILVPLLQVHVRVL